MRLLVVGGKLQGVEACYLARQAGWTTALVDRSPRPPASGLCDEFHRLDITREPRRLDALARSADAVLPALEDGAALAELERLQTRHGLPVLFDFAAFRATEDKYAFQLRFERRMRMPPTYPCPPPYVVKPRLGSGSHGVRRMEVLWKGDPMLMDDNLLVQHFVEGAHWSVELVSREGVVQPHLPARLGFDSAYSCCRVLVPRRVSTEVGRSLAAMGGAVARGIRLSGLMDIQAIQAADGLYLLEANARLPSQTPMAVHHAGGANLLEELVEPHGLRAAARATWLEHVQVSGGDVRVKGERVMASAGPLRDDGGRWGAQAVLTDVEDGEGVATLVFTGRSLREVARRRVEGWRRMTDEAGVGGC